METSELQAWAPPQLAVLQAWCRQPAQVITMVALGLYKLGL